MIRPVRFESNPQTLGSNAFQSMPTASTAELQRRALAEFDALVAALEAAGVEVFVYADTPGEPAPRTPSRRHRKPGTGARVPRQ
jgi:hypothetical protein